MSGTAFIAGASRGLGLGLARELLGRGWSVIATSRAPGGALAEIAGSSDGRLRQETLDIDDRAAVRRVAEGAPSLDLLFVNAGITDRAGLGELRDDAFAAIMRTNALSPVLLAVAMRDRLREGGTVAFMTSRMGSIAEMASGNNPAYRASKAALNALTRCFVAEHGRGLTVLSFHPGWVRTDMGGPSAPVTVEESARGIASVIERERGRGGHRFLDYQGQPIPW